MEGYTNYTTTDTKVFVNNKMWDEMQNELSIFSSIHLKIKDHKVSLQIRFSNKSLKAHICVFINGWMKGDEEEELKKMFWFEKKMNMYSPQKRKAIVKEFGKRASIKHFPKLYKTFSYYTPVFNSFSTLKNQYKKRHKEIYWIKG